MREPSDESRMERVGPENRRFEDELGQEYDFFPLSVPHYHELEAKVGTLLSAHLRDVPNDEIVVVEGGVGTGDTTLQLLSADPRVRVVAIDNEPTMIAQAKQKLESYADRVQFVEADVVKAVQQFATIQVFVSGFTIHNLSPVNRSELFQALGTRMPSGSLLINADKIAQDDETVHLNALREQLEAFAVFAQRGKPELRDEWTKHYLEDDTIRFTELEQRALLEEAGFHVGPLVFRARMDAIVVALKRA